MKRYKKLFRESFDIRTMLNQYLITALWSSVDDNDDPMDENYTISDIDKGSVRSATKDCKDFVRKAGNMLNGLDPESVGHDFWLTRNGHGAGFRDGDYEESIGEELTKLSNKFGEKYMYVGDDGSIYIE